MAPLPIALAVHGSSAWADSPSSSNEYGRSTGHGEMGTASASEGARKAARLGRSITLGWLLSSPLAEPHCRSSEVVALQLQAWGSLFGLALGSQRSLNSAFVLSACALLLSFDCWLLPARFCPRRSRPTSPQLHERVESGATPKSAAVRRRTLLIGPRAAVKPALTSCASLEELAQSAHSGRPCRRRSNGSQSRSYRHCSMRWHGMSVRRRCRHGRVVWCR